MRAPTITEVREDLQVGECTSLVRFDVRSKRLSVKSCDGSWSDECEETLELTNAGSYGLVRNLSGKQ